MFDLTQNYINIYIYINYISCETMKMYLRNSDHYAAHPLSFAYLAKWEKCEIKLLSIFWRSHFKDL